MIEVFDYKGSDVAFQLMNKEVKEINLTQMASANGKRLDNFMRLASTKSYIEALTHTRGGVDNQVVKVVVGGDLSNGVTQGTWACKELALEFARWISPGFSIWCNQIIMKVMIGEVEEVNVVVKAFKAHQERFKELSKSGRRMHRPLQEATREVDYCPYKWLELLKIAYGELMYTEQKLRFLNSIHQLITLNKDRYRLQKDGSKVDGAALDHYEVIVGDWVKGRERHIARRKLGKL